MTRVEQWLKRRDKMLRRAEYGWNQRKRGPRPPYMNFPQVFQHQGSAPAAWSNGVLLKPRVKEQTFRKEMRRLRGKRRPANWRDLGKGVPPVWDCPYTYFNAYLFGVHSRQPVGDVLVRTVKRRGHKPNRLDGQGRAAYIAYVYWSKRGAWPDWDPKGRKPVESPSLGKFDNW